MRVLLACILSLSALPALAGDGPRILWPAGTDLADNPDLEREADGFPRGWTAYRAAGGMELEYGPHGIDGAKGVRLVGPSTSTAPVKPSGISRVLAEFPAGTAIEVTAWIRLEGFQGTCVVWARCDGADGGQHHEGAFHNSQLAGYDLTGTSRWCPVTVRVTPAADTKSVAIGVLAGGTGTVSVHSIHARVRKPEPKPMQAPTTKATGPGLYRAEGRYVVMSGSADGAVRAWIPVPILWRDQVPIDFRAWTEPAGHLASVTLHRTGLGFHYAEAKLEKLPRGASVRFFWAGHVLVLPHRPSQVPAGIELPLTKVPDDVTPWLAGTWCCDTGDPEIARVATEIRKAGTTADVVVPATLARMREIYRTAKGHVANLTASEALTKRGSCTSCANLGAALFRAHGIPARVVAGYPTWSGPLQTHYVVEYWLPEGGWRLMESTMCRDDRPGWEQIEVAMVRPEDEAEKVAGRRFSAAGGVPWLSLTEYPDARKAGFAPTVRLAGDMPDKKYCDHRAVTLAVFPEKPGRAWTEAAASLAARWRTRTAAAVRTPAAVADLAPAEGTEDAKSLRGLLDLLK